MQKQLFKAYYDLILLSSQGRKYVGQNLKSPSRYNVMGKMSTQPQKVVATAFQNSPFKYFLTRRLLFLSAEQHSNTAFNDKLAFFSTVYARSH